MANGKFEIAGLVEAVDNNTVEITELPIRKWTQDYKEWLDSITAGAPVDKDKKKSTSEIQIEVSLPPALLHPPA